MYDLTNLTNTTNLENIAIEVNKASNSFLFIGICVALFIILFVNTLRWGITKAFATSSFISALVVSLLFALKLVPWLPLFIFWVATGFGIMLLYFDSQG